MPDQQRVVVWRNEWLPQSNTFIRDQLRSYSTWQARSASWFRLDSPLTEPDAFVFRAGRLGETARRRLPRASHAALAARKIRRLRPDLLHAHFGTDALMARDVAQRVGVPLVVTFHGYDVTALNHESRPGYETSLRRLVHDVDLLIAVSGFIRSRLLDLGAPPDRVVVHHTGVPIPDAEPTMPGRRGVVFVGRLVEKKGVADLLRCYAELPPELRTQHPLTIIGDGPLDADLRRIDSELGTEATFTGNVASDRVSRQLSASAVACVPSKTAASGDSEGLPTVILEAGARGAAVIASDHSGSSEAVINDRTGVLFDEGDSGGLLRGLRELLEDRERRERLALAASGLVRERFDIVKQTRALELIYPRALDHVGSNQV